MGYVIDPGASTQHEVRRLVRERLGDAVERLDSIIDGGETDVEHAVHEVRKRCKESRGVARLVQPALGGDFARFDRVVRAAANQLSELRDAHALLATFDTLLDAQHDGAEPGLRSVRDHQAVVAAEATATITGGDERIAAARELLADALDRSQRWRLDDGFAPIGDGLADTYRLGRRQMRKAESHTTDHRVHEWRKAVKYLWYQCRLLRDVAPSVIGPLVDQLDALSEALGDDHDLAVLVERLDEDPARFGGPEVAHAARELARSQQTMLRDGAFRAGAAVYAEPTGAFRSRMKQYWRVTAKRGPEQVVGGIATLAAAHADDDAHDTGGDTTSASDASENTVERERKFLVTDLPADIDMSNGAEIRQGYLVTGERVTVRVRETAGNRRVLALKAGRGRERTELEWPMSAAQFDAAWSHTEGRRITKTRHRIPAGDHVIELDVFSGAHDGLRVAEVEFDSSADMDAFQPPVWFGREVSDDDRYSNAVLATDGLPVDPT